MSESVRFEEGRNLNSFRKYGSSIQTMRICNCHYTWSYFVSTPSGNGLGQNYKGRNNNLQSPPSSVAAETINL